MRNPNNLMCELEQLRTQYEFESLTLAVNDRGVLLESFIGKWRSQTTISHEAFRYATSDLVSVAARHLRDSFSPMLGELAELPPTPGNPE